MKLNRRQISGYSLILGMSFLAIGLATGNRIFTWVAIAFVLISLLAGGRWLRPRKK